jgi:hypothetical protein
MRTTTAKEEKAALAKKTMGRCRPACAAYALAVLVAACWAAAHGGNLVTIAQILAGTLSVMTWFFHHGSYSFASEAIRLRDAGRPAAPKNYPSSPSVARKHGHQSITLPVPHSPPRFALC